MDEQNAPVTPPPPTGPDQDSRRWAMITHLSALIAYVGVPFGHIAGPLILWIIKKDRSPFIDDQGKEAVNFQISMTIYALISAALTLVLIGFVLLAILVVLDIILIIIAAVQANSGQAYRYPLTIRFLK